MSHTHTTGSYSLHHLEAHINSLVMRSVMKGYTVSGLKMLELTNRREERERERETVNVVLMTK